MGLAATTLLLLGCSPNSPDTSVSSTPVATPIVVGTPTPQASGSPEGPSKNYESSRERETTIRKVEEAIEKARAEYPGRTAVYFIDIESDQKLDFNGEQQFESASLMKLVVIAEMFHLIQMGKVKPDTTLTLKPEHIVGGAGDLKDQEPGMSFPIKVLAEKMITQSDNTATQMLTDFLTRDALTKSIKNLGLSGTTIDRDVYDFAAIDEGRDNYITAKDAAHLMAQLAREELPGSDEIHAILERQQRNDMIGSGVPDNVRVAHKTGELNGILHDVGVVYAPRGVYVLALLSDQVADKDKGIQVWRNLSQEILRLYRSDTPSPSPSGTNS